MVDLGQARVPGGRSSCGLKLFCLLYPEVESKPPHGWFGWVCMGDSVWDTPHVSEITGRAGQAVSQSVCCTACGAQQNKSPGCRQTLPVAQDGQYLHFQLLSL